MTRGALFCFRCRRRFEPGEEECPHCRDEDAGGAGAPVLVVRPSFPTRWFLAEALRRLALQLVLPAVLLAGAWGFEPRGLAIPAWVQVTVPAFLLVAFLAPSAYRWSVARRAARYAEFRFHPDRLEFVVDPLSREEGRIPLAQVTDVAWRRLPFLPGRGRVLLLLERASPWAPAVTLECVAEPERLAERVRALVAAASEAA